MAKDTVGNQRKTAKHIQISATERIYQDKIGSSDLNDFYGFRLNQASSFNFTLAGLKADVNVRLRDRQGNIIQSSVNTGTQSESIYRNLKAGFYYLQVFGRQAETSYRFKVSAQLDKAGDRLSDARDLFFLQRLSARDWVGKSDPSDYYKFTVNTSVRVDLALNGLSANANLQLFDNSGALVQQANTLGIAPESISTPLQPGTYYVHVAYASPRVGTAYTLDLAATVSETPSPTPSPAPTPIPGPIPNISLVALTSGLSNPLHITNAGDGSDRLFAVEQAGRIRIIQNGTLSSTPFLDISGRVRSGGEEGLLSVAFPPNFAGRRHFYVYYTNKSGNNVVARYNLQANGTLADPNSEQIVLTLNHPNFDNHNGGQLTFGSDGYLYIGTGDGGGSGDPNGNAQNPQSLLGKLLRIDVESAGVTPYTIPSTNPFVGVKDVGDRYRDEIWALGLRNPWRFSFDRQTGDLFIADVGQGAYEEVDYQPVTSQGGENYGWNRFEGAHRYNNSTISMAGFTFPVAEYDHSQGQSITGGFVYRGAAIPQLQGVYLYSDFINGRVWGLRHSGNLWENRLLLDSPYSISSFGEDEQGNVYVADYSKGIIYKINP